MNQNYNVNKKDLDANLVEKKRLELLLKKLNYFTKDAKKLSNGLVKFPS